MFMDMMISQIFSIMTKKMSLVCISSYLLWNFRKYL